MKVLNSGNLADKYLTPEDNIRVLNKTSLGAISEADSHMEGSKAVLITSKGKL